MTDRTRPCAAFAIWAVAIIAGGLVVIALGVPGSIAAQTPPAEPTFVTLLNRTPDSRTVEVQSLLTGISSRNPVPSQETLTIEVAAGAEPLEMVASCRACHSVYFAVAGGQRLVVVLAPLDEPAIVRSDLHIVNDSEGRRQGVLRTGAIPGAGRTLLPFDLRAGESLRIGVRTDSAAIDLNLTCFGCGAQRIRMTDAVDLEVVLR